MNIERPFDFLDSRKGKTILIKCKSENNLIHGKLIAWDVNVNLILEIKSKPRFIRGDQIVWIE